MKDKEAITDIMFGVERLTEADADEVLQRLVQRKYEKTLAERVDLGKRKYTGRPSRMQPEVTERLLVALRQGASINMACKFAGISHDLFSIWSKKARTYQDTLRKSEQRRLEFEVEYEAKGRKGRKFVLTPFEKEIIEKANKETMDCVELFVLIDQAVAECGIRDLAAITKAANNGAWTAAAFRLGKRFPEDYGTEPSSTNLNVNVGFNYVEINKAQRPEIERADMQTIQQRVRQINNPIIDVESQEVS